MKLLAKIIGLLLCLQSSATHLVGGEIYYDYLGNNIYKITLIIYRDCGPTNTNGTQFDNQAMIGVFNNGIDINIFSVPIGAINNVPVTISNPCLVVPPSACIEEARYEKVVSLPPIAGGYDIVYQRCCRNPSTQNIQNPNSQGATYHAHIPENSPMAQNSSPRFLNYPPSVLCVNNAFTFDHSATDTDGDSLTYELCTPYNGANFGNPAPIPDPPPFVPVTWATGYNVTNQIQGTPGLAIDASTGELTGTPTIQGIYTFGVSVKEYRNGILLSESRRDYQFWVTSCDPVLIAGIPQQTDSCSGLTVQFNNTSIGSSFYHWDFDDGTTSTAVSPQHTFPSPGTYNVMLIANPGWPCADTAYMTYNMQPPLNTVIDEPDAQCLTTNTFDFSATGNYGVGSTFFWDFGANANPSTSTDESPTGIVYLDSGRHEVYMYVTFQTCLAEDKDTVEVHPVPVIDFSYPPKIGCAPYTVQFSNTSQSWENLSYYWFYSDGGISIEENPIHTFDDPGTYDVGLIIQADSICYVSDTLIMPGIIKVNPSPEADFLVSPDRADVFRPYFELTDLSSADVLQMYYIDATGDTIYQNLSGQHIVNDTGYFGITQWVYNVFGCHDTAVRHIFIEPITTIYIPNAFSPNNDGTNDIWMPVVRDVYDYELRVYDRWGKLVFITESQTAGWDGTLKGKKSPPDVYVYKISYRAMNRLREQKVGHFSLVR